MGITLDNKPKDEELKSQKEQISAVLKDDVEQFPLEKALVISTVAHPLVPFLVWFLIFILALFGINFVLFPKPQIKPRDIEFVLVQKEATPINKKTNLRSDRNSRAGGKHDPTKRISPPEKTAVQSAPKQAAPQQKAVPKKVAKSAPRQQSVKKPDLTPPKTPPKIVTAPKPVAQPKLAPPNPFSIPVPKVEEPKAVAPTGGPVTSGPIVSGSPSGSPSPVMTQGGSSSAGSRGSAYSLGGGSPGNPGPGNPNGAPGVDALKEPDFGPYMLELQRRIKRNWHPPRGNESKRVVLLFKVSRDGRLLSLRTVDSSGNSESDSAALDAVKVSAPFRPLPPEYRGQDIDIQFTFDYNVFSIGGGLH